MTALRIVLAGVGMIQGFLGAIMLIPELRAFLAGRQTGKQPEDRRMFLAGLLGGAGRLAVGAWLIVGGLLRDGLSKGLILGLAAILLFLMSFLLFGLHAFDRRRWQKSSGRGT